MAGVTGGDKGTRLSQPGAHALGDLFRRGRGAEMRPRAALGSGAWGSAPASQVLQDKHLTTSGSRKHGRERLPGPGVAPHRPAPQNPEAPLSSTPLHRGLPAPPRKLLRAQPGEAPSGQSPSLLDKPAPPSPGTTVRGTGPWGPELGSVLAGANRQQTDAGSTAESWRQGWCPHEPTTQQTKVR